jgi:replicative DNA helicase
MCNCAVNSANAGRNVLYVSLEMSEQKVMKRVGSTRLRIPVKDYDNLSRDTNFMKSKIQELHLGMNNKHNLFEQKLGKIFVREFPSGSLTVHQLDAYVKRLQQAKGIKIDLLLIDYLTLMDAGKGMNENLYLKGKHLAEGVRAIAQKYNLVAISATQVSRDAFNANDINAKDMSESKAIYETADTIFGIIRTEEMKKQNIYIIKSLKLRDSEFKWTKARFEVDWKFMQIHNDSVIE